MTISMIIGIILIIIASILIGIYYKKINNLIQQDNETKRINEITKEENRKLESEQRALKRLNEVIKDKVYDQKQELLENNRVSKESFEQYCDILEDSYKKLEKEYDNSAINISQAYDKLQDKLITEYVNKKAELNLKIQTVQQDLDKISATRAAAQEAINREKEIKEQLDFYCLQINTEDLDDIAVLNKIKPKLHQPRILSMLIWSTYYQKPMTQLCNNILGTQTKCGIYKITNQITNECYIGQSVDIAKRWKDHAKCGLGIDTPVSNKLYKSMLENGLHNFSFELLEECSKEELNEKEMFYIHSYQSNDFGFNTNKGTK